MDMFHDLGKETFISQLTSTFYRKDLFEDLIHLDIPIFIFYSKNDRLLNKKALEKLSSTKHEIVMISREGTSHNIPLEAPFEFATNIKKWMSYKK